MDGLTLLLLLLLLACPLLMLWMMRGHGGHGHGAHGGGCHSGDGTEAESSLEELRRRRAELDSQIERREAEEKETSPLAAGEKR